MRNAASMRMETKSAGIGGNSNSNLLPRELGHLSTIVQLLCALILSFKCFHASGGVV